MRLRSWDVDLNPFKSRPGEVLVGRDVIDHRVGDETVSDVAIHPVDDPRGTAYEIAKVRLTRRNLLRRKPSFRLVDVDEVPGLFPPISAMAAEAARLRDLHPSEVAGLIRNMPLAQRRQLAAAMDDERLADLLEELSEPEQIGLIEGLDLDRLMGVLDEMEYDDLADLLGEMSGEQRGRILEAMDAEDADVVRRLLSYEEATAGGMMTPDPIVLGPTATVADALAQIREPDWVVSIAAQVFVCHPPFKAPTGKLLGTAHMQRLLREQPSTELRDCVVRGPRRRARGLRRGRRRAARQLRHARRRGVRSGGPPPRRGHRRRRPGPPARRRLAPAPTGGDEPDEDRVTPVPTSGAAPW